MDTVHTDPQIRIQNSFLNARTCNHFIKISKDKLKKALVSSDEGGVTSKARTGKTAWIEHDFDTTTLRVAKRISKEVGLPLENAEAFQIIHYDINQFYQNHTDSWDHDLSDKSRRCMRLGGQRILTALCYLNTPDEGGSTRFTRLNIDVPAEKGKLLVFSNVYDGTVKKHPMSEHAGTPVISGKKYAFNLWFRQGNSKKVIYDPEIPLEIKPSRHQRNPKKRIKTKFTKKKSMYCNKDKTTQMEKMDRVKQFEMTKTDLESLKKGEKCYDGPLTGNVKCIVLSLFLALFYWYAPPRNKWILIGILYFTYLFLAYYDYHYDCRYGEFGPSPLKHFYDFAKPKNSKQSIVYESLCKNKANLILIIDVIILIGILALFPTFLKWKPKV